MPKILPKIEYASVDSLFLDPTNPRLGRHVASAKLSQEKILEAMQDWTLDELATSFLESGFWPQEALIVIEEPIYGKPGLVVVEGNRRLAALKLLQNAFEGRAVSKKWKDLAATGNLSKAFFASIPYMRAQSRREISAYLGFRHVTGIKEWKPAEKAEYIAMLIDEQNLTYDEVRRKIGSKTPTVRQHYIAYKLLLQMDQQDDIHIEAVEDKFSVLYLSLRTHGAQSYLGIDIQAEPDIARIPVDKKNVPHLANYAKWLFGTEKLAPLITDSRHVDTFGKILASSDAIEYLERTENPHFEVALRKSGASEENVLGYIDRASDNVQLALSEVHLHKKSRDLQKSVRDLGANVMQLMSIFPSIQQELAKEWLDDASNS